MTISIEPMTGALGAEVLGVDLSRPSGDAKAAIDAAFAEHLVLVFRDQSLDLAAFGRFAETMGAYGETPFITPIEGHPNVLRVLREADECGALFGGGWHSDWSFQPRPPSATLLYGVDIPGCGGDTVFTDQRLAYDRLSTGMKRMLEGVRAAHTAQKSYAPGGTFGRPDPRRSMEITGSDAAYEVQMHPIVRAHPASGRKALFIDEVYTVGVEDMTEAESAALLSFLFAHSRQISFTARVRWAPGTLVMWDNRATQHHAIDDYAGQRREMWRITLAGEVPV